MEIICVNDGSLDNSAKILQDYSRKNHHIKIINQTNQGVSSARNTGLKSAKGNYIGFIDSDDYIPSDYYEKLLSTVLKTDSDMAIACVRYIGDTAPPYCTPRAGTAEALEKLQRSDRPIVVCDTLFRQQLIAGNNIKFNQKIVNGEDQLFGIMALYYAKRIAFVEDTYYYYCINDLSTLRNPKNKKRNIIHALYTIRAVLDFIYAQTTDKKVRKLAWQYINKAFNLYDLLNDEKWVSKEEAKNILGEFFLKIFLKYYIIKFLNIFFRDRVNLRGFRKITVFYIPIYSKKIK